MNSGSSETREKFAFRLRIIYHEAILLWQWNSSSHAMVRDGRRGRRMAEILRHMISYSGAICHNKERESFMYSYDVSTFKWDTKENEGEKSIRGLESWEVNQFCAKLDAGKEDMKKLLNKVQNSKLI